MEENSTYSYRAIIDLFRRIIPASLDDIQIFVE